MPVITTLDSNPDRILKQAEDELTSVVVLGWDKKGEEFFASSIADAGTVIFMLERAKHKLLKIVDEIVDEG